jgi:hypothetical protein
MDPARPGLKTKLVLGKNPTPPEHPKLIPWLSATTSILAPVNNSIVAGFNLVA